MTSSNNLQTVCGVLLVDKPVGPTSFRMVQLVRRILGIKKVGHAGTLDPFASGLLIICVGRPATRMISGFMDGDKVYDALLQLGVQTDTMDQTGNIISESLVSGIDAVKVEKCLQLFKGRQLQTPPAYSALKYKGKPLYYYARKGQEVIKEPREIVIKSIEFISLEKDILRIKVVCSKGTYIRKLASDIGNSLGCGAHLRELRRLKSGDFSVTDSLSGDKLEVDREQARNLLISKMLPVELIDFDSFKDRSKQEKENNLV